MILKRVILLLKADYIDAKVAYPDFTYNDTYLDTLYKEVTFVVKIVY